MLIDEILRALRDPEYRAQLTREARGALPDDAAVGESFDADQESESELLTARARAPAAWAGRAGR